VGRYFKENKDVVIVLGIISLLVVVASVNVMFSLHSRSEDSKADIVSENGAGLMASYTFTGAGDSSYNGTYVEDGIFNGQMSYTNGTNFLFWALDNGSGYSKWTLAATKFTEFSGNTPAYAGEDNSPLPAGTWVAFGGAMPAPTVGEDSLEYVIEVADMDDLDEGNNLFIVNHRVNGLTDSASGLVLFVAEIRDGSGVLKYTLRAQFVGNVFATNSSILLGGARLSQYLTGDAGEWTISVTATPYLESLDGEIPEDPVSDSDTFTFIPAPYAPPPDPPDDPDPGDSDLTMYGVYIDDGEGNDVESADTEARVGCYIVEGGLDTLSYIVYELYKNGVLIGTYTDSSASAGANEHTFSGSWVNGNILKAIVYAYDGNGDYVFGSYSCGVGGVKNKSIVIGDAAADFDNWVLTDVDLVDTDNLELAVAGSFYKLAGTVSMIFDSGYDGTVWDMLSFTTLAPTNTGITFKVRTAATRAGLASATLSSAISTSGQLLSSLVSAGRWIEIIAYLSTTDNTITPTLYSVEVFYSADAGDEASKKWDTTTELEEATLVDTVVEDGVLKLDGTTLYEYEDDGYFILRVDAGAYVNWLTLVASLTTPAGTEVKFKSRSFNDPTIAGDSDWSEEFATGASIPSDDALYLDIMCILRTTDSGVTPVVTSITVDFQREITPSTSYVYTTKFELPSRLGSLLLADVQYNQDPACFVQYRYAVNDDTDWSDMLPLSRNTLIKVLSDDYLSGENLRVAAKLVSCSESAEAVLDEFAVVMALENGRLLQIL